MEDRKGLTSPISFVRSQTGPQGCPLCGSERLTPLNGYEEAYLVRCLRCNFVSCNRKPTAEELTTHYSQYPRGSAISSITIHRYEALLVEFQLYRHTNRILDLGCGDGHFLEVAQQKGWAVYGTEFTDDAIRICREKGIVMKLGPLRPGDFQDDYFDVVTSFEVIEHLAEPRTDVCVVSKFLRSGGLYYVTTPNFNSISRTWLGSKWSVIEYPEHLGYFTTTTLSSLFGAEGYVLKRMQTTGISLERWQAGGALRTSGEQLRQSIERNWGLRAAKWLANWFLNALRKGDNMKAYFVKR